MTEPYQQQQWDDLIEDDCRQVVRLAVREDLDRLYDLTTLALIPAAARGGAAMVARRPGTIAGLCAVPTCVDEMNLDCQWHPLVSDGALVEAGTAIGRLAGSGRDLLTAERILLNLVGRLSGIATLTASYVQAVAGTKAQIYDTRKTTPGWRRLEKYAVRCGGGTNHRQGLYDAILIKDNHLALAAETPQDLSPAQAVVRCREFLQTAVPDLAGSTIVEVEVDTLEQLREVLVVAPDVVLLDNMNLDQLREAVRYRDQQAAAVQLEASGGIDLHRVGSVAATGVDRISVGALTHAAASLDIGLDWQSGGDACEG